MYAITILQPWAHLIAIGEKDIGQRIAIHVGKSKIDPSDVEWVEGRIGRKIPYRRYEETLGCIIATAILDSVVVATTSKWYAGRKNGGKANYGFVLRSVRRCEPIPCTGALSL